MITFQIEKKGTKILLKFLQITCISYILTKIFLRIEAHNFNTEEVLG